MTQAISPFDPALEEFLAELTAAAYRVSLRYGVKSSFIDLELGLWRELRAVLRRQLLAADSPPGTGDRSAARPRPDRPVTI